VVSSAFSLKDLVLVEYSSPFLEARKTSKGRSENE
jgi:hypothetical protein